MSSAEEQSHDPEPDTQQIPEPLVTVARTNPAPSLEADSLRELSEHDGDIGDIDSAVESWRSVRTQSLTSSVTDFQYENGRRYHAYKEGSYHLPNDEEEQDRLDMQHAVFRYAAEGRLFTAPVAKERLHNILDVGCGTGLWAIDVADENPQAQVLGIDLSPIQPNMVPPNCRFLVNDCNAEWVFAEKFDLIHTRAMTPGVKDWPKYLRQAYDQLTPGGFIELQEVLAPAGCTEATAHPTPYMVQWSEYLLEAAPKVGLDLSAPSKFDTLLPAAGFKNVNVQWVKFPLGPWAKGAKNKHIGRWWAEDMKVATTNAGAMFTRILGWKQEEFHVFAAKIKEEIDEQKKHTWIDTCFAYAQKPMEG